MAKLEGEMFLMPFQDQPFNGDRFMCTKFIELRDRFNITNAIELGCCVGGTTKWLSENFERVVAIEINHKFLEIATRRASADNIEFLYGDTVEILPKIINSIGNDSIFHIDSHWGPDNPLLAELEIIATSGIKPVIEIHDFKIPDYPELGFDTYKDIVYEWRWIEKSIDAIYGKGGYVYEYNNLAEGAKRGCIYIYPI